MLNSSRMSVGAVIERETSATHSLGGSHYLGLEHSYNCTCECVICFVFPGYRSGDFGKSTAVVVPLRPVFIWMFVLEETLPATFLRRFLVGAYAIFHFVVFLLI